MAEALLKKIGGNQFEVESAGLEPGSLNPLAVESLKEVGIDISRNQTKSVFDLFKQGRMYTYVITVCDETNAERCPTFPGIAKRVHWTFEDPATVEGSRQEKLAKVRTIRNQIESKLKEFVQSLSDRS